MNAIYSCCIVDPFLDVARTLESKYGVKPVYWIGDIASAQNKEETETMVKKAFPQIEYQSFFDAWHGKFSPEIMEKSSQMYVDIDFLNSVSSQELQALSMMDRLDYDHKSFNYMERESYFLNLVKRWLYVIDKYKPDVVISPVNPHRVFDYVLYILCRYKGIKFISFQFSIYGAGRIFPLLYFSEPNAMEMLLREEYEKSLKNTYSLDDLTDDFKKELAKLNATYDEAIPYYMKAHNVDDVKNKRMTFLFKRFMKTHHIFGKHGMLAEGQTDTIYKNTGFDIETSRFSIWDWYRKRKEALKYSKELHAYYNQIASPVSLDKKYIIFFLHYQPEETTSPCGGIFANQTLCIETLLKNTPDDVYVYIKEHPNQFMSHMQGHTKRIKRFYDDLIKNPRVRFVPLEMDSFTLIKKAMAVSTVTGTVGWESVVRKKPVIIFGVIWYECMRGVLRVKDDESASKIYEFIKNYKYDEQALYAYLHTFAQHTIQAYHYSTYKEVTGISHDDSVNRLVQAISSFM